MKEINLKEGFAEIPLLDELEEWKSSIPMTPIWNQDLYSSEARNMGHLSLTNSDTISNNNPGTSNSEESNEENIKKRIIGWIGVIIGIGSLIALIILAFFLSENPIIGIIMVILSIVLSFGAFLAFYGFYKTSQSVTGTIKRFEDIIVRHAGKRITIN